MKTCHYCGCLPKNDEWASENFCIDCGYREKVPCPTCKGNGYLRQNMVEIHQCAKCKSQGEIYA
mgnify:CR=1 FL=1